MTPNRHPDTVKLDNLRLVAEDAEALLKKILAELEEITHAKERQKSLFDDSSDEA